MDEVRPPGPDMPLVLIPGFMCDARLFAPQIATVSRTRPVQIANVAGQDTIEAMAASVLRTAPLRFAVAGLSMGGMVAMAMVSQAPERIAALGLLATDPLPEPPKVAARRETQMQAVREGALRDLMRDRIAPWYAPEGSRRAGIIDLSVDMAVALGPEVFLRQAAALRDRPDLRPALAEWRGPTLILCGALDAMCPLAGHELMHGLVPGSRLEVIPDTGHLPTLERPEATTAALEAWLAG